MLDNEMDLLYDLLEQINVLEIPLLNMNDARDVIYNFTNTTFTKIVKLSPGVQKNESEEFLFQSIQNLVMASFHRKIFPVICEEHKEQDEIFYKKCCELSTLKVTPDQLGALVDYAIPFPATVVELASLDLHETPSEKLTCFATAFDLAMAELKGAIVDVIALSCDYKIPALNACDITPILATIIVHAKPMHLISNLYYIENYYWTGLTSTESECLLAFQTAIDKLKVVTKELLLPRSTRIYCDIGLEDIFKLTSDNDDKYNHKGQRIIIPNTPLERHIEHFTNLISASTLNNL